SSREWSVDLVFPRKAPGAPIRKRLTKSCKIQRSPRPVSLAIEQRAARIPAFDIPSEVTVDAATDREPAEPAVQTLEVATGQPRDEETGAVPAVRPESGARGLEPLSGALPGRAVLH